MQAARRTPDAARAARRGLAGLALCLPLILVTSAAAQEGGQAPAQPAAAPAAGDEEPPAFTTEQLEQMLAPIALYPDDLLSQVLMACTYPLEVVQADRWVKLRKDTEAEQAAKELEAEDWDASVKSLIAVPEVLAMLSDELDWTQQLGDAFIAQPQELLAAVQTLRIRAHEAGKLESSEEQTVTVEPEKGPPEVIVIESASPDVIYVPVYDTTVVYGYWPYHSYPPYPYYPPAYRVGAAVVIGFAWGYAWGHCDWHGGDVDIDINRNVDRNRNIDRARYKGDGAGGRGPWKHDPAHRGNLPYRDQGTAKRFGGVSTREAAASRESFRGRGDAGSAGSAGSPRVIRGGAEGGATPARPTTTDRSQTIGADRTSGRTAGTRTSGRTTTSSGTRNGALDGVGRSGSSVKRESNRGQASRSRATGSRASGSRGGSRGAMRGGGRGGRR